MVVLHSVLTVFLYESTSSYFQQGEGRSFPKHCGSFVKSRWQISRNELFVNIWCKSERGCPGPARRYSINYPVSGQGTASPHPATRPTPKSVKIFITIWFVSSQQFIFIHSNLDGVFIHLFIKRWYHKIFRSGQISPLETCRWWRWWSGGFCVLKYIGDAETLCCFWSSLWLRFRTGRRC